MSATVLDHKVLQNLADEIFRLRDALTTVTAHISAIALKARAAANRVAFIVFGVLMFLIAAAVGIVAVVLVARASRVRKVTPEVARETPQLHHLPPTATQHQAPPPRLTHPPKPVPVAVLAPLGASTSAPAPQPTQEQS